MRAWGSTGLNPYDYAPAAIPGDEAASRVEDFRSAVSVYGPLWTLGSYPLGALGVPAALWSMKAIAAASVVGIAVLSARLAAWRGLDPGLAGAFVALNPLVLVHVVGGAHNDALMVLLAMLGIAAALSARPLLAGAGLVAAVAVKVSAGLYVPFALAGSGRRLRLLAGIALAAAIAAAVALLGFGPSVLEALNVAGNNQDRVSRWSVPGTLSRGTGLDVDLLRAAFAAAYAITVIGLLVWVARGADWIRAAGWAAFGLLVASAYMVPWYLIWLLPLAAISRDRTLVAADGPPHPLPGGQRGAGVSPPDPRQPRMRRSPEFDLIGEIRRRLGATATAAGSERIAVGIGDDAAVTTPGGATAVSVDALVDGVGFRRAWCPPRAIGRKALGAALSDLAAMGANPGEAYVWLGMPADLGEDACLELCDGIAELAGEIGRGGARRRPDRLTGAVGLRHGRGARRLGGGSGRPRRGRGGARALRHRGDRRRGGRPDAARARGARGGPAGGGAGGRDRPPALALAAARLRPGARPRGSRGDDRRLRWPRGRCGASGRGLGGRDRARPGGRAGRRRRSRGCGRGGARSA